MQMFDPGTAVRWNWGDGTGEGEVVEVFTDRVSRTIKGTDVVRDADDGNPAYLIRQADGDEVLKSHSELDPASRRVDENGDGEADGGG